MNGIQEAINAMTAEQWGQVLAEAVVVIISIYAAFVVIQQSKRLLAMVDDPDQEDSFNAITPVCRHCDCVMEDTGSDYVCSNGCGTVSEEDGVQAEEASPHGYHPNGDAMTEAEYHEDYHAFLAETDSQEAADYAEEHGLDTCSADSGSDDHSGEWECSMCGASMSFEGDDDYACPSCGVDTKSQMEDLFWDAIDRHDFHEAKSVNEDFSLGIEDFEGLVKAKAQAAIHSGDFQTADDLCNEWGIDKLELEWH